MILFIDNNRLILLRIFQCACWSLLGWLSCTNSLGQDTKVLGRGIRFLPSTFQQAQQAAARQQKPLFIEVYLTGCPHCEALAPVLAEKLVGTFYNTHFVSWQVEANQAESKILQQKLHITFPEFPLFLFLGVDGTLQHVATPAEQTTRTAFMEEVLRHGQTALDPNQRSSAYSPRFEAGERDLGFLIQAGKYWKTTRDTLHLQVLNDAFAQRLVSEQEIVSPVGLYVLNRYINDFNNPLTKYFFTHLTQFKAKFPAKDVLEAGESVLYRSLYGPKVNQWSTADIIHMREAMVSLGTDPKQAMIRTLVPELDATVRAGKLATAIERVETFCRDNPSLDVSYYAYFMHFFNQKTTDTSYLGPMSQWAAAGFTQLKAKPDPKLAASIYYELAIAQQKEGQRQAARENARKGLDLAKVSKIELKPYQQLLDSLL